MIFAHLILLITRLCPLHYGVSVNEFWSWAQVCCSCTQLSLKKVTVSPNILKGFVPTSTSQIEQLHFFYSPLQWRMVLNRIWPSMVKIITLKSHLRLRGKYELFKLQPHGVNLIQKNNNSLQHHFPPRLGEDTWWIFWASRISHWDKSSYNRFSLKVWRCLSIYFPPKQCGCCFVGGNVFDVIQCERKEVGSFISPTEE